MADLADVHWRGQGRLNGWGLEMTMETSSCGLETTIET